MTATSVNNLVFRAQDKLNYLEHPIPAAPILAFAGQQVPPEALAAHAALVKVQKEIDLKTLFSQQAKQELLQTMREFHVCKQEEVQSISLYVLKMKSYIDNLECQGHPVSLNLPMSLILVSLRKEYDSFVQNYNMHGMGKMVNELHAMLKLHEQTLPKKDAPTLHAIRAGKIPHPPKKENPAKDSVCHQCGDTGHWKRNCPQYLYELLKNMMLSQGARLKGSRKLNSGALSMYMCNGQRAIVEAVRSYDLCFPSGLVAILLNCHYAPSITRGVISVSYLYDDGFINRFDGNTILVSRNNVVYFSVVPRDDIYEIDFSNSNANYSSMYVSNKRAKLNLDSTLLWHYRLGHISKKYPKETMGYSFYYPLENKVFVARNVEFLEDDLITQEASGSLEDLKIIQEQDTHPSENTSIHHDEGDFNEPGNYKVALLVPKSNKWLESKNVEVQSMKDNEVWDLVDLPPDRNTVSSKWLFK
ncbi:zinc finger, CCHC-type containing protein [Tanacetum coccineum]